MVAERQTGLLGGSPRPQPSLSRARLPDMTEHLAAEQRRALRKPPDGTKQPDPRAIHSMPEDVHKMFPELQANSTEVQIRRRPAHPDRQPRAAAPKRQVAQARPPASLAQTGGRTIATETETKTAMKTTAPASPKPPSAAYTPSHKIAGRPRRPGLRSISKRSNSAPAKNTCGNAPSLLLSSHLNDRLGIYHKRELSPTSLKSSASHCTG